MENLGTEIAQWSALFGTRIVGAVAILIIGRIVVGFIGRLIRRLMVRGEVDETLRKFFVSLIRITLMAIVILAALNTLGIQTTSLVAMIGAAVLAVGFALKESLGNFAAGVMMIIFKPFEVGDYVEAGGTNGSVEAIQIFNTVLKTPDNKKVIVPNGKIIADTITNYSFHETRRVDMVFDIGYDDDIVKAKHVLNQLIEKDDRILKDPAPVVAVSELADSSVRLVVRPWAKTADYWNVHYDFTEMVKLTFDMEGITIPYPQTDVHLRKVEAG